MSLLKYDACNGFKERCITVANEVLPASEHKAGANGVDYVGIIGACGGLITAMTGFFQLGSFSSSFAFLFLSFLLFWLMFKNNTVNKLYMASAAIFLVASMLCIYFVSFQTVHVYIRRTDPLEPDLNYPVYIQPGGEDLSSKKLSLNIPNLATVTIDLNKADFQMIQRSQRIENTVFETAKNQISNEIVPAATKSSAPQTAEAIKAILGTAVTVAKEVNNASSVAPADASPSAVSN
jgi:hypothetical protein